MKTSFWWGLGGFCFFKQTNKCSNFADLFCENYCSPAVCYLAGIFGKNKQIKKKHQKPNQTKNIPPPPPPNPTTKESHQKKPSTLSVSLPGEGDILTMRKQLLSKRNLHYGESILKTDIWKGFNHYVILLPQTMHVTCKSFYICTLKKLEIEISNLFKKTFQKASVGFEPICWKHETATPSD